MSETCGAKYDPVRCVCIQRYVDTKQPPANWDVCDKAAGHAGFHESERVIWREGEEVFVP